MRHAIKGYFKNRSYPDLRALAAHTSEISQAIAQLPKHSPQPFKPRAKLNEFDLQVFQLAPRFRKGVKIRGKSMAREILVQRGVQPTRIEIKRLAGKINKSVATLKAQGKLVFQKEDSIPLTAFQQRVLELVPSYRNKAGRYDRMGMAKKILEQTDKSKEFNAVAKIHTQVHRAMAELVKRKLLPSLGLNPPAIKRREALPDQITANTRLVHWVLRRGHRFLVGDWRKYISYEEAMEVGKQGLARGIETFDETRGAAFSTHAVQNIAGRISTEVKKLRTRGQLVSLDQPQYTDSDKPLSEKIGTPAKEKSLPEEALEHMFKLYQRKKLKPHHAAIWTLRNVYGHTLQEIGDYFQVQRERIRQIEKEANLRIGATMR